MNELSMNAQSFPASYAQRGLWLSTQLSPGSYQLQMAFKLPFRLDPAMVHRALATIVDRHETLRTSLVLADGDLMQVVHDRCPIHLPGTDLGAEPAVTRASRLRELVSVEAAAPFELADSPLWRARLVRCADDDWYLIFVAHHLILDATSIFLLRRELHTLLRAATAESRSPDPFAPNGLPELAIQYADYSLWQLDQLATDDAREQLAWWRGQLAGAPTEHSLPTDRPRPVRAEPAGGRLGIRVPGDAVGRAVRSDTGAAASPFMVLLTAFAATVGRVSGADEVLIGTPVSGRDLPELAPLIGMFVNTLPIRVDLTGDPTFAGLVDRTRAAVLDAWDHQGVPFDRLVEELAPDRVPGRNPIFQIGFNLIADRGYASVGRERWSMGFDDDDLGDTAARFDLHLDLYEQTDCYVGLLEYSVALFDAGTAATLADRFRRVLVAGGAAPQTPLSDLPVLTEQESRWVAAVLRPAAEAGAPCLLDRIGQAVADHPDHRPFAGLALAELHERAALLASRLALETYDGTAGSVNAAGSVEVAIGIAASGPDVLATGVLAALRSGRPFLVLDPDLPAARTAFLLRDARIDSVVTSGFAPAGVTPIDPFDQCATEDRADRADRLPTGPADPDAVAWIVAAGGRGLPRRIGLSRTAIEAAVRPGPVDGPAVDAVPAVLAALLAAPEQASPPARSAERITFGECGGLGVTLSPDPPDDRRRAGTVDPELGWWVRDDAGRPAVPGTPGELCLTGPTVAIGYLDRPGPTAEAFTDLAGTRSFRTGLSAVQLPGGQCRIQPKENNR